MGYYGCHVFRPGWVLMRRSDVPQGAKDLIKEGLIMAGDRLVLLKDDRIDVLPVRRLDQDLVVLLEEAGDLRLDLLGCEAPELAAVDLVVLAEDVAPHGRLLTLVRLVMQSG
jgi:hypothetical protein